MRLIVIFLLGIASGMPLLLTGSTLTWRLATFDVDITTIGLFAFVGLPYAVKFLWAPLFDRIPAHRIMPRRYGNYLGQRRAWLVILQPLLALAIIILGHLNGGDKVAMIALAALAVSFLSASQDTVIDAYRIEILSPRDQGKGAAASQYGYRCGLLFSGGGALLLSQAIDWGYVFLLMAFLLYACGSIAVLLGPKHHLPKPAINKPKTTLRAVLDPIRHFIRDCAIRDHDRWATRLVLGAMLILAIILYRASDAIAGVMATVFYHDIGFSAAEVGAVSKVFGLGATLVGIAVGALMVSRLGCIAALLWCGGAQMLSNAMFAALAVVGYNMPFFTATIAIENLSGGMASAAFVAFLSALCRRQWAATQYALLSALAAVGRTVFSSGGGWIVTHFGWFDFFALTILASAPALVIFALMRARLNHVIQSREHAFSTAAS